MSTKRSNFKASLIGGTTLKGGAIAICMALMAPVANAGPTGGIAAGGSGITITGDGTANVTVTQTNDRGLITWNGGFNIADGETTTFIHQDTRAVTVNRDTTGNLSSIDGTLQSCLSAACTSVGGSVWIINPAGVTFGPNAVVDVGGLLATTAEIADPANFPTANLSSLSFAGTALDGSIVVDAGASITGSGSLLALVAPSVSSDGDITNIAGDVMLASSQSFDISFASVADAPSTLELFNYQVTAGSANSGGVNAASGTISAQRFIGDIVTASGTIGSILNIGAAINATTATATDDGVVLSAVGLGADKPDITISGVISNTGNFVATSEGAITSTQTITGSSVSLNATGALDVQGITATSDDIDLSGDSVSAGNLSSDGDITTTSTSGSATVGTQTATGSVTGVAGTSYTSGLITTTNGAIDVDATSDVTIAGLNSGAAADIDSSAGDVSLTGNASSVGTLALTATAGDVTTLSLTTSGAAALVDIDAAGAVNTLNIITTGAGSDIDIDAGTSSTTGDLTTTGAGSNADVTAVTTVSVGNTALTGDLVLTAGTDVTGGNLQAGGNITTTSTAGSTTVGTQMATGSVTAVAGTSYTSGLITTTNGAIDVGATNDATIDGFSSGSTSDVVSSMGDVVLTADASSVGAMTLTSTMGDVTGLNLNTSGAGALVDVDAAGLVDVDNVTTTGASSSINIFGNISVATGDLTTTGTSSSIAVEANTTTVSVGDITSAGAIELTAETDLSGGNLQAGTPIITRSGGTTTLGTQTGASVTGISTGQYSSGLITSSSGLVFVSAGSGATVAGINSAGTTDVRSGGDIVLTSDVLSVGEVILDSSSGDITALDISATGASSFVSIDAGGAVDVDDVTGPDIVIAAGSSVTTEDLLGSSTFSTINVNGTTSVTVGDVSTTSGLMLFAGTDLTGGNLQAEDITTGSTGSTTVGAQTARGSVTGVAGTSYTSGLITTTNGAIDVMSVNDATIAGFSSGSTADVVSSMGDVILTADASSFRTMTLTSTTGDVTGLNLSTTGASGAGAVVDIDAAGLVDVGNITTAGASSDIDIDAGASATTGDLTTTGANSDATVDGGTTVSVGNTALTGNLVLTAGTDITGGDFQADGDITTTSTSGSTTIGTQTAAGFVTAIAGTSYTSGLITTTSNRSIDVMSVNDATIDGVNSGSTVDVVSSMGDVVLTANASSVGTMTLTSIMGDVTGLNLSTSGAGALVDIDAAGLVDVDNVTTSGAGSNIDIDAGTSATTGNLTTTGAGSNADITAGTSVVVGDADVSGIIDIDAGTTVSGGALSGGGLGIDAAAGSISVGDVSTTNLGGSLSLRAGGVSSDITTGTVNSNSGDILLSAGRNINTGAIANSLSGAATSGSLGLHAGGAVTTGSVDVGEDLLVDAVTTVTMAGGRAGDDVNIMAGGDVNVTGDLSTDGAGVDLFSVGFSGAAGSSALVFAAEATPGSNISITSTGGDVNTAALSGNDDVVLNAALNLDAGALSAVNGDITTTSTAGYTSIGTQTAAGSVTGVAGTSYTSGLITTMNGAIDVNATNDITIAGLNSGAAADIDSSAGDISLTANASSVGTLALTATAGDVTTLRLTTSGAAALVDIDAAGAVETLNIITSGAGSNIDINAGTSVETGSLVATGADSTGNVIGGTTVDVGGANTSGDLTLIAGTDITGGNLRSRSNIGTTSTSGSTTVGTQTATGSVTGVAGTSYTSGLITTTNGAVDVMSMNDATIAGFSSGSTSDVVSSMGDVVLTADASSVDAMTLRSTMGDVTGLNLSTSGAGALVDVDAAGAVNTLNIITTGAGSDIDIDAGTSSTTGDLTTTGAGSNADVTAVTTVSVGNTALTGDLVLTAGTDVTGGNLQAGGNITTTSTAGSTTVGTQMATGSVTAVAGTSYTSGLITTTNGAIDVGATNAATIDGFSSGSTSDVVSSMGDVVLTADASSVGALTLNSAMGAVTTLGLTTTGAGSNIDVDAGTSATTGDLTTTGAGSNVDVTAGTIVSVGNADVTGTLDLVAGGSLNAGDLDVGGDITASATDLVMGILVSGANITTTSSTGSTLIESQTATASVTGIAGTTYNSGPITTTNGAVDISADDDIIIGSVSSGDRLDVNSTNGEITIVNASDAAGNVNLIAADNISLSSLSSEQTILVQSGGDFLLESNAQLLADSDGSNSGDVLVVRAAGNVSAGSGSSIMGGASNTADVIVTAGYTETGPSTAGDLIVDSVSGRNVRLNAQGTDGSNITVFGTVSSGDATQLTATDTVNINGDVSAVNNLQIFSNDLVISSASGSLSADVVDLVSRTGGMSIGEVDGATNFALSQAEYETISASSELNLYGSSWGDAITTDTASASDVDTQNANAFSSEFYTTVRPFTTDAAMANVVAGDVTVGDLNFTSQASSINIYTISMGGGEVGDVRVIGNVDNGGNAASTLQIGDFASSASGWRPDLVHVSGSLGNNGTALSTTPSQSDWLGGVQIAANTIVFGTDDFLQQYLDSLQTGPDGFRPERIAVQPSDRFRVWLAANSLELKSNTEIIQQNTGVNGGTGSNTFGIFATVPQNGSETVQAFTDGGAAGPGRVELFGVMVDANGQVLLGSTSALVPDLLESNISREAGYRINACSFGTTTCTSVGDFLFEPSLEAITSQVDAVYNPEDEEEREAVIGVLNTEPLK